MINDRPHFIVIGAMKCATSSLHEQFARLPGVFMSTPKEPNFFSDDGVFDQGIEWYRRLFHHAAADDICGESSTHYTKLPTHPNTIERMRESLPESTRFIYVIRHPIDRLISQYVHEWSQRIIDCEIERAIGRFPMLIEYSLYAMQLQPYFDAFGKDRVLPMFFERLRSKPEPEFERACRFIGYEGEITWQHTLGAQNQSAMRLRKSNMRDRIVNLPGVTFIRKSLVPQSWRDAVKRRWMMTTRPELTSPTIRRLTELFDQDLAQLESWCGMKLTCDSFVERVLGPVSKVPRGAVP